MKKIYLLSLICCMSFAAFAQVTTTIYCQNPAALTYVSGNCSSSTRTDDPIVTTGTGSSAGDTRGYAVFDLSSIPADAQIVDATLGFNIATISGSGSLTNTDIRGWDTFMTAAAGTWGGDMSYLVTAATLFPEMPKTVTQSLGLNNGSMIPNWITGGSNKTYNITTFGGLNFIERNFGRTTRKLTLVWTGGDGRTFTITGHTGTATTTGAHAPYLTIKYCPKPKVLSATASPNPVCPNAPLTLTGSATGTSGPSAYTWIGPGMTTYIGTSPTKVVTASTSSAGVYTFVATNSCGSGPSGPVSNTDTMLTLAVSLLPSPGPIGGPRAVCVSNSIMLFDASGATTTTWSTTASATLATVGATTGIVNAGTSTGTAIITLTEPGTGCWDTAHVLVNAAPAPIGGLFTAVCENSTINLTETSTSGAWISGNTLIATVTTTGIVTGATGGGGISAGAVDISYSVPGCPDAIYSITVNPVPAPITGPKLICQGGSATLNDGTPGGTWTTSNAGVASITSSGSGSAVMYGVPTGNIYLDSSNISYTLTATGCMATEWLVVSPHPNISGPAAICQNEKAGFTESTGTGGSWSSSDPTVAVITSLGGIATGGLAGTAIISYTASTGGCSNTVPITVNPIPQAIGGIPKVCQHDISSLTDADPGGIWTSSNTALATVNSVTGDVSGILPGTPIITYTFPATGCYNIDTITVMAAPVSIIGAGGPTTFCIGGSVVLSAPPGYIYQWFRSGATIVGATGMNYTATTTDSFTVGITNANGCYDLSAPLFVSAAVSPTINAGSATSFCAGPGNGVTLTANTGAASGTMFYQWQKNGVDISAAIAVNYFANTTGVYTCVVSITGASGVCVVTSTPENVYVRAVPNPHISNVGATYNTAVLPSYATYQWYLNTVSIPGATSANYAPIANGSYRVFVTDTSGCANYSNAITRFVVGVGQINSVDVKIYPNPATEMVHIESAVKVRAVVTGLEGKTLIDQQNVSDLNISGLANGMYMIMLYDENGDRIMVEKLIKE